MSLDRQAYAGMDKRGLANLTGVIDGFVESKKVAGAAMYIARHGRCEYRRNFGWADIEQGKPIADDTIFRIYSMSKPITVVCMMQLYERGKFALLDPIEEYVPEFREQMVAVEDEDGSVRYEKPRTPITFQNLFTMTSGLAYGGTANPAARAMETFSAKMRAEGRTTGEALRALPSQVPLAFHPGQRWMYGYSHDVLGALVEVISGKRFSEYMKENVLDPIGMKDTAFWVPQEKLRRLSNIYSIGVGGELHACPEHYTDRYLAAPAMESGGGGLVSTMDDYAKFAQMLVSGGMAGSERIIGRKTLQLISTDHLTDQQRPYFNWTQQRGYGYGLGVRTCIKPHLGGYNGSVGEFGWDGMAGTWFCADPAEDMVAVYMTQMVPGNHSGFLPVLVPSIYSAVI